MAVIDSIDCDGSLWYNQPEVVQIPNGYPNEQQCSDEQFVSWCLTEVMRRPEWVNAYIGLRMLRDLGWGRTTSGNLGLFAGDMSLLGDRVKYQPFNRDQLFSTIKDMRARFNNWELARANKLLT